MYRSSAAHINRRHICVAVVGAGERAVTLQIGSVQRLSNMYAFVHTPEELLEMSRSLKAPRIREITQIRLPSAIPHIFSALKVSITLSVIGAVVAEFVAAERGLGYAILFSTSSFKVPTAFANLAVL